LIVLIFARTSMSLKCCCKEPEENNVDYL